MVKRSGRPRPAQLLEEGSDWNRTKRNLTLAGDGDGRMKMGEKEEEGSPFLGGRARKRD